MAEKQSFWKRVGGEFKQFALRGNMVDLAVGVIIGGAFNAVVASLVKDIISPLLGLLTGNVDFSALSFNFKTILPGLRTDILFNYGAFFTAVINFLLTAFAVFLLVKGINALRKPKAEPAPAPVTTKACPFCLSAVPPAATRCPHCTSALEP